MSMSVFKNHTANDFTLDPKRVDIWIIPLHQLAADAYPLLNEEELIRAKRFYFERHQRRFAMARSRLRLILAQYLRVTPQSLQFTYNKQGKPQIESPQSITFNLSHSGEFALLAVSQTHEVGIDLEQFSARPYLSIADNLFSAAEIRSLQQQPASLRTLSFFTIWAQKEAFIKASGLGLSYPTQDFDVPALPGKPVLIDDKLHQQTRQMISFMPMIGYSAALCCHPETNIVYYEKY